MRIVWSQYAVSDLKSISEYMEQDRNLDAANRIARRIYESVQSLRTMPYRGRYGRIENTRELSVSQLPYIIVYQVHDQQVLVLNIVHGARKWP
jgi:toxin ParE1/3/4